MKRDKLYEIVIALILANLGYFCSKIVIGLMINVRSLYTWGLLFANIMAIWGVLWLFRDYKKRLNAARKERDAAKSKLN
jgi:lipopolysaccharide export LptBFGC system permease protein LptF